MKPYPLLHSSPSPPPPPPIQSTAAAVAGTGIAARSSRRGGAMASAAAATPLSIGIAASLSKPRSMILVGRGDEECGIGREKKCVRNPRKWRIGSAASSSSSSAGALAAVDLKPLESALEKKDSDAVKKALNQLTEAGWANKWSSQPYVSRRTQTSLRELTSLGIKNAENLAIPSVRNDAAFLFTVVGTTGFLGVLAGQLPGDWGFFVPYLLGGISLVVLAIGSTSPGLLQAAISSFSAVFPDYQERIARHEAAHFLVAYLLGVPILGYSLDIGKEHVNLIDEKLEKLIYSGQLDTKELGRLAVVAMAGLAAEGLTYDKVVGQSADLFTLQRFINRSKPKLSKDQQQNLTRWAVLFAGSLLKNNKTFHEALIAAMQKKATVLECIQTIETG